MPALWDASINTEKFVVVVVSFCFEHFYNAMDFPRKIYCSQVKRLVGKKSFPELGFTIVGTFWDNSLVVTFHIESRSICNVMYKCVQV